MRINDIVENYISKRIKKDAQIEAFNKQIQSAQKEKQRAETKDEKDVIGNCQENLVGLLRG